MINQEEINIENIEKEYLQKINSFSILLEDESLDMQTKNNIKNQINELEIKLSKLKLSEEDKKINLDLEELKEKVNNLNSYYLADKKIINENLDKINTLSKITQDKIDELEKKTKEVTDSLKKETQKNEAKVETVKKIIKDVTIFDTIEDTLENVGKVGSKTTTSILDKLGIKIPFLKKMNPIVLGLILIGIVISIAVFIFTFVMGEPAYEFPLIGSFLGSISPWQSSYPTGWNQNTYGSQNTYSAPNTYGLQSTYSPRSTYVPQSTFGMQNQFGSVTPGPPGGTINI